MSSDVQPRLESCSSFKSQSHARMRCFAGSFLSLNKSAHQARSDFHVLGGACSHASLQKLHVHDCLLLFCCKNLTSARDFAHHPGSILSAGIDVFEEDLSRRGQTS
jgi:hypothetical protein